MITTEAVADDRPDRRSPTAADAEGNSSNGEGVVKDAPTSNADAASSPSVDDVPPSEGATDSTPITAATLDDKQTELLQRLGKVRDCKRQVLEMLDQLKAQCDDDPSKIDKATLSKLVTMYDGFAEQETNYVQMLQELVELKREQVTATANEARELRERLAEIKAQQTAAKEDVHPSTAIVAAIVNGDVAPQTRIDNKEDATSHQTRIDNKEDDTSPQTRIDNKDEAPQTCVGNKDSTVEDADDEDEISPRDLEHGYVLALRQQRDTLKTMAEQRQKLGAIKREKAALSASAIDEAQRENNVLQIKAQLASERGSIDAKREQLAALKSQVANIERIMGDVQPDASDDPNKPVVALKTRLNELHAKRARFDELLADLDDGGSTGYDAYMRTMGEGKKEVEEVVVHGVRDEAESNGLSVAKSEYADKVREQQTALDDLLTERERLDEMHSKFARVRHAESEAPPPAAVTHTARPAAQSIYRNPRMSRVEYEQDATQNRGMSEPASSSLNAGVEYGDVLARQMIDAHSLMDQVQQHSSRSGSTMPSSAGMSGEAQMLMWQQQMLTTSIMQQQLYQQSMQMQQMQSHIHNLTSAIDASRGNTPVPNAAPTHNYPTPPAMHTTPVFNPMAVYGDHPLSCESMNNLFAPYPPPMNLLAKHAAPSRSTSRLQHCTPQLVRRTRSSSRTIATVPPLQLSVSADKPPLPPTAATTLSAQQTDELYNEVAILIAQNGDCPKYLLDMFRELQQISNASLRRHALRAIHQLLLSRRPPSVNGRSRMQSLNASGNSLDASQVEREFLRGSCSSMTMASTSLHPISDRDDFEDEEEGDTRAIITTDSNSRNAHVNSFCKSLASGQAILRPLNGPQRSASAATLGEQVDMASLRPMADGVVNQLMPFVQEKADDVVNARLLTYIRKLVVTLTLTSLNETSDLMARSVDLLIKQLAQSLDETLNKYVDHRLSVCSDALLNDVADVIVAELAFHRFMQDLHIAPVEKEAIVSSTLPPINTGRSTFRASSAAGSEAEQVHDEICRLVGAADE